MVSGVWFGRGSPGTCRGRGRHRGRTGPSKAGEQGWAQDEPTPGADYQTAPKLPPSQLGFPTGSFPEPDPGRADVHECGFTGQTPPQLRLAGAAWGRCLPLPRASSAEPAQLPARVCSPTFLPPVCATGDTGVQVAPWLWGGGAGTCRTCSQHPRLGHAAVARAMVMM